MRLELICELVSGSVVVGCVANMRSKSDGSHCKAAKSLCIIPAGARDPFAVLDAPDLFGAAKNLLASMHPIIRFKTTIMRNARSALKSTGALRLFVVGVMISSVCARCEHSVDGRRKQLVKECLVTVLVNSFGARAIYT